MSIIENAGYIVNDWLKLKPEDRFLIVTNSKHIDDICVIKDIAEKAGVFSVILVIPENKTQIGTFFNSIQSTLDLFTAIMGAAEYSLLTNKAVSESVKKGARFLSFPMSTNSGKSILSYDFLSMDYRDSLEKANKILPVLSKTNRIRITTEAGTDLTFDKTNRKADCFAGVVDKPYQISSSSFEVYIPIIETATEGRAVLDGSMGYLGKPDKNIELSFSKGKISVSDETDMGRKLSDYLKSFCDENIYNASELGIGLNTKSQCRGDSYIEDESTYGTFHIGMGRNIALGGKHNAKGHFDLVFNKPTIYAEEICIMRDGELVL